MKVDKNDNTDKLIIRYLSNNITDGERLELESWINSSLLNANYYKQVKTIWENSQKLQEFQSIDADSSLKMVKQRIQFMSQKNPVRQLYWNLSKVAAVFIILFGIYWILRMENKEDEKSLITKVESKNYQKEVILPDSTIVFLNRYSQLIYSEEFGKSERKIEFSGEAYFQVSHDKAKPFIIETGLSETKVLGTSFSLSSVNEDRKDVLVVTEGLVQFSAKSGKKKQQLILHKGEKAVLTDKLSKEKNADINFLSWKTGIFTFKDEKLPVALELFSDYYGVEFVIENNDLKLYTLNGSYQKLTRDELIAILKLTLGVEIEQKGSVYSIKK